MFFSSKYLDCDDCDFSLGARGVFYSVVVFFVPPVDIIRKLM